MNNTLPLKKIVALHGEVSIFDHYGIFNLFKNY